MKGQTDEVKEQIFNGHKKKKERKKRKIPKLLSEHIKILNYFEAWPADGPSKLYTGYSLVKGYITYTLYQLHSSRLIYRSPHPSPLPHHSPPIDERTDL